MVDDTEPDPRDTEVESINAVLINNRKVANYDLARREETKVRQDQTAVKIEWKELLKFKKTYYQYRPQCKDKMAQDADMWDGHLARLSITKQGIKLTLSNSRPIHSAPCRSFPARGLWKDMKSIKY